MCHWLQSCETECNWAGHTEDLYIACLYVRRQKKEKRLEWAQTYIHDTFENVVWSDETTVQMESHRRYCYRKDREKAHPKPSPRHATKLHVWAGISSKVANTGFYLEKLGWGGNRMYTHRGLKKKLFRALLGICTLYLNPGRAVLICQINHSRYPRDNRSARLEGNVLRKSPYSIPQFGKNKQTTTTSNYGSQNNAGIFPSTLLLFPVQLELLERHAI